MSDDIDINAAFELSQNTVDAARTTMQAAHKLKELTTALRQATHGGWLPASVPPPAGWCSTRSAARGQPLPRPSPPAGGASGRTSACASASSRDDGSKLNQWGCSDMSQWTAPLGTRVTLIQVPALIAPEILLDALFHATIYDGHADYSMFMRIDAARLESLAARIREAQGASEEEPHG